MNSISSKPVIVLFLGFVAAAGAFGCSSSASPSGTGTTASTETFTDVYTTIRSPKCATHHAAGASDSFLDLSTQAAAYTSLVNVKADGTACAAAGAAGLIRVVPGSAATSLLYEKVSEATPQCGAQMPYDGPYLAASDQEKIETWITEGALNN